MCIHSNEGTCHPVQWLTDVFIIGLGQQWSPLPQRKSVCLTFDAHTMLVCVISLFLILAGLGFVDSWKMLGFVGSRENVEYYHP